jgi:hypothetical protein
MQQVPRYIRNFQSVIDAFGYWPSFHDSPVLRFHADSKSIELEVEAWEMTSELDERGYFRRHKKHHIGFRFSGLVSTELADFIPDNILFELAFSSNEDCRSQGFFRVELDSAMGSDLCGQFSATEGEITFI